MRLPINHLKYPGIKFDLYFTPEPSHMLKLARNAPS